MYSGLDYHRMCSGRILDICSLDILSMYGFVRNPY